MASNGDLLAGAASFCVPGLGQLVRGNTARALMTAGLALAAWAGPGLAVGLHFFLLGQADPVARAEADAAIAPFAWLLRMAVHLGAAYDAGTGGGRRLPDRRRPVSRPRRRRVRRRS